MEPMALGIMWCSTELMAISQNKDKQKKTEEVPVDSAWGTLWGSLSALSKKGLGEVVIAKEQIGKASQDVRTYWAYELRIPVG